MLLYTCTLAVSTRLHAHQAILCAGEPGGLGMHCRQKQQVEQRPPDITDILSACPRLLQMTAAESKRCMAATSKNLRQLVHSSIKTLTVDDDNDLHLIQRDKWPELGLIVLRKHDFGTRVAAPGLYDIVHPHRQASPCIWLSEERFVRGKLRERAMALLLVRDTSIEHGLNILERFLKQAQAASQILNA